MSTLSKKEKAGYIFKISFFLIFGIILAGIAIGMIVSGQFPLNFLLLIFYLLAGGGVAFSVWSVRNLWKEYRHWIDKESKESKEEQQY